MDKELQQISEDYLKTLKTEAIVLLANNDVYVAQFVKVDLAIQTNKDGIELYEGSGQLVLKFLGSKGIPRKQEYFVAIVLDQEMCLPRNWGNISWGKLRQHQVKYSDVHCVWQGKADEKGFLLCGFQGLSIDMAKYLIDNNLSGYTIILGPQEPPLDYYQNLISIVTNKNQDLPIGKILDYDDSEHKWNPTPITSKEQPAKVIAEILKSANEIVVQGPPGTGKTYMMANIITDLLDANKSVLVTALTNRALIELALKESLAKHLESGNIFKTNISADEIRVCKNLVPIESKVSFCGAGKLTLTTFYNSSGWATVLTEEQPFDYVIMDEASQSLFAMTAACKLLGKKVVWIGDQKQLPPVVSLKDETIIRNDYSNLVEGFQTLCDNFDYPSFVLTDTFRLQPRAAELTSVFYDVPLVSVSKTKLMETRLPFVDKRGGTSIVEIEMPNGEKANKENCDYVIGMVAEILSESPKISIAILSKFRSSVRLLQNCFISRFGSKDNVIIDTVERVQGMTCDICIYYVPNTLVNLSLNKELFNVVTSRAKQFTVIVADKSLIRQNMQEEVRKYLLKAQENK